MEHALHINHRDDALRRPGAWFTDASAGWRDRLAAPEHDIHFEYQVPIRMPDGVDLRANIWRPAADGEFPVVVVFTPYDNTSSWPDHPMNDSIGRAKYFVPRGYAFVSISARGHYGSGGDPYLFWYRDWQSGGHEGYDVQACLAWLAEQPWSTGDIGMTGVSYLAMVQWMGAIAGSPHLKAMIPIGSPDDNFHNVHREGALSLSVALWLMVIGERRTNEDALWDEFIDWDTVYRHLPLRELDQVLLGKPSQHWKDFLDHADNDDYWRIGSPGARYEVGKLTAGNYPHVDVPSLNITGWYDSVLQNTINNYLGAVTYGSERYRDAHQLIIGPWIHNSVDRRVGDLDYGPQAAIDLFPIEQRWFDHWLKGIENGILEEPRAHVFLTGANEWHAETEWPPAHAVETPLYLDSGGRANSLFGDGRLSFSRPDPSPADEFIYDPEDPVPSYGGGIIVIPDVSGPRDRRAIQQRADVLVYTTERLGQDVEITGRILARLFAASSAPDTDFVCTLVDVHPNGYAALLATGNLRARYRNSFKEPELITPGEVYEYTIDLWSLGHVFKRGHAIRLEVTSSNFPWFDRNPNTGEPKGESARIEVARQTVLHDADHGSCLILPIVTR